MNRLLTLLAALFLSAALAHSAMTSIVPAPNATVTAPKTVTVKFSEPLELRFSTFRVMAVPAGKTAQAAATLALAQQADSPRVVSLPLSRTDMAAQISVPLKSNLKPGLYVVAWKILSGDGHPVSGHSTFRVK